MRAALFLTAAAAGVVPTAQQVVPTVAPALPGAATPYLEEYAVDGLPGTTTYRLYMELSMQVYNLYTVYGSESAPASFPPAEQLDIPFGTNIGTILATVLTSFDGASVTAPLFAQAAATRHFGR